MKSWTCRTGCGICLLVALVAIPATAIGVDLSWTPRADVIGESFGRGLHGSGVINNRIYLAGGGFIGSSLWMSYRTAVAYDPMTDSWAALADMPTRRAAPASAVASYLGQTRLYVIGGIDLTGFPTDHAAVPDIEEYDPLSDSWRTVGAGMPDWSYAWGGCAVEVDGLIHIMGGANAWFDSATTRHVAYDPDSDSFTTFASMPVGMSDGACVVVDRQIYYLGGYEHGAWGAIPSAAVLIYDLDLDSWQTAASTAPVPRTNAAAVAIGTEILVIGGWNGSGQYSGMYNTVDAYDTVLDAWTTDVTDPLGCVADDGVSVRGRAGLSLHEVYDSFDDLLYAVGGNIGISDPTRCNEASLHPIATLIRADSFQSGTTGGWDYVTP